MLQLAPEQVLAVRTLARRMNVTRDEALRRLVGLALHVTGMDQPGAADVDAVTAAALTEDRATVVANLLGDAHCESWPSAARRTEDERAALPSLEEVVPTFPSDDPDQHRNQARSDHENALAAALAERIGLDVAVNVVDSAMLAVTLALTPGDAYALGTSS